ncbi:uncharacterized protein A1O5_12470 [Cladophialophora psammophila CBS 110553]|uniref:Metallo-beta-lactamase domain-containing protein n=1 Tax=Cladophialophora psammophila CBS 110553 TaxID=1182543 RepID=W9VY79_9EURO|nr:uncharacterized protein A1O5_12470 [Cladophialophora psammophila CBS 110553]EXJ57680.1 hypothetical protein A1O5_12470 [Cladophialophora psammophila CBS 110553]
MAASSSIKSRFPVPSGATATVSIIDTTSRIGRISVSYLMEPPMPGFDTMPEIPSWSFLVESSTTGKKALFDLGVPPDWENFAPAVSEALRTRGWQIYAEKHTSQVLEENGVDLKGIGSDPSTFPPSTEVVVGPGFKEAFMPGYPGKQDSPVRESDFKGRELREITFTEPGTLQIGDFRAIDFFGDGSFYLLDTPGHAVGHVCGLARTTCEPDTFIFMGGDLCHHGGEIRPSAYKPLPRDIWQPGLHALAKVTHSPCPGAVFEAIQQKRGRSPPGTKPFFDPAMGLSIPEAIATIEKAQKADADDNVLFIYAHDATARGVADLFPLTANDWKKQGWREGMFWAFLADFRAALPT